MDGGIAAAICVRHLRDLQSAYKNHDLTFKIEPVPRPKTTTQCLSGLLRKQYKEFDLSIDLINQYDDLIDCAELMHNRNSLLHRQQDIFSLAQKLYLLFTSTHELIDKSIVYCSLVDKMSQNPNIEELIDSDDLYASLIAYENNKKFKSFI